MLLLSSILCFCMLNAQQYNSVHIVLYNCFSNRGRNMHSSFHVITDLITSPGALWFLCGIKVFSMVTCFQLEEFSLVVLVRLAYIYFFFFSLFLLNLSCSSLNNVPCHFLAILLQKYSLYLHNVLWLTNIFYPKELFSTFHYYK